MRGVGERQVTSNSIAGWALPPVSAWTAQEWPTLHVHLLLALRSLIENCDRPRAARRQLPSFYSCGNKYDRGVAWNFI